MTSLVPNILTAARLIAVPALAALMWADHGADGPLRWWALFVFLAASATDFLDGYLARRWQVVTAFGKLADPIADKALVLGTLALLIAVDDLAWWPVALLAVRELWVTLGRLVVARRAVIAAGRGGKLKTALQVAAITFYLVPHAPPWLTATAWWLLLAAVAVALVSGVRAGRKIADANSSTEPVTDGAH